MSLPADSRSGAAVHSHGKTEPRLRVLIVDDEALGRQRLTALLGPEETVELIGECADGPQAIATIQRDRPDVVFLDLQMPGCDGLEVINAVPVKDRPAFVLVTAHAKFAVEAFAVRAVDYVLKPFDRERLLAALGRAGAYVRARRTSDLTARVENLLATAQARQAPGRLGFKADGRVVFLKPEEIFWVEADNNHAILHLASGQQMVLRDTLSALEEQLGLADFSRINRSAIVRLDQVRELRFTPHGDQIVVLLDGTKLPLSRGQRGQLGNIVG